MISDASLSARLRLAPGVVRGLTALVLVIEGDGVLSASLQQLRGPRQLRRHGPQLGGELGPGPGERGLGGEVGEGGAGLPSLLPVELVGRHPGCPVHPHHGAQDGQRRLEAVGGAQAEYEGHPGVVRGHGCHMMQDLDTRHGSSD